MPPKDRSLAISPAKKSKIPADATTTTELAASDFIKIGNRRLSARPRKFGKHWLDALPDMPDIRDRIYSPRLGALRPAIYPRLPFSVHNQGEDSSCTGYALAHVIDHLRFREVGPDNPSRVSPRMLYEMAKRNDEWAGSAYEGSSIRGAIKGFYRNGVCSVTSGPDVPGIKDWTLTYEMAKEARNTRLGAYFRLEPDITDYHAALNDVGAIYASAQIHSNWDQPQSGHIVPGGKIAGGHAFAIVGYDETGFWVLNAWGPDWGMNGVAHWTYADWASTIMDAWVLQIGVRAPAAFGAAPRATLASASGLFSFHEPNRGDIIGHFINIDEGRLQTSGRYSSPTANEMEVTVSRLVAHDSNDGMGYDHLVIYAHGGLNSLGAEAERIATWKRNDVFGRNRIYNFHLMWGSGFIDEVFGEIAKSPIAGRVAGKLTDWLFEAGLGKEIGSFAWRNMKRDADMAFNDHPEYDGGFRGLQPLLSGLDKAQKLVRLHLVGHSAGAIVLGHLLSALDRFALRRLELGSIHLMAPACTVEFFKTHFEPYSSGKKRSRLKDKIYIYSLTDKIELADSVSSNIPLAPSYSRSLLYLVSRAYEELQNTPPPTQPFAKHAAVPIAGMQIFQGTMTKSSQLVFDYSGISGNATKSQTHGGFDNDVTTLTTIMSRVLQSSTVVPPTEDELTGY